MDLILFRLINNFGSGNTAFNFLKIFCASYFPYIVVIILLSFLFIKSPGLRNNRIMVIISLAAATVARFGVKEFILLFYDRARPFVVLSNVHQLIAVPLSENYQSFPSGHAIFFFALSSSIFLFNKRKGIWFTIASVVIGIGRILVGVHWPSDILFGFILGSLTSWVVYTLYFRNKKVIDIGIERICNVLHI